MRIAFLVFDGITWLDLIGCYDPLSRLKTYGYLPDLSWDFCCYRDLAADHFGLTMKPTRIQESLSQYDILLVPGGYGTRDLIRDPAFVDWVRTAAGAAYKISVCTGSLILGAAGFLQGRRATTHFAEYDALRPFCGELSTDRIVEDGDAITAGAVSAGIDLGLYLCRKWAGPEAEMKIRQKMDYRG